MRKKLKGKLRQHHHHHHKHGGGFCSREAKAEKGDLGECKKKIVITVLPHRFLKSLSEKNGELMFLQFMMLGVG